MLHKNLDAWKLSIELVIDIYKICSEFPSSEKYVLSSHLKKTAISIPSNLAEGSARDSNAELNRFINISMGSLSELETQLIIAEKLNYLKNQYIFNKITRVRKLLLGLKRYLKTNSN